MLSFSLHSSPHQRTKRNTTQVMQLVVIALLPALAAQYIIFGWGVVIQCFIAVVTALVAESLVLALRKKQITIGLSDYSAVVTAILIAMSIPPLLPWWMTVLASAFAIIIVKQLYGGMGFNLFNPAMAAYVMLLISFPAAMTNFIPPLELAQHSVTLQDTLSIISNGFTVQGYDITQIKTNIDGITMATPLDHVKTSLALGDNYGDAINSLLLFDGFNQSGLSNGHVWVNIAYLLGGLFLLTTRVISWQIPVSFILSLFMFSLLFHLFEPSNYGSPLFHLFNGGIMIGAFFIATDPVTAATTAKGRLYFGALIGFWIFIIRTFGGYPDAVAFAILLMNMTVPLIDYYTQPRVYGRNTKRSSK